MRQNKILVTGATGFLGRALCDHSQRLGWHVTGVGRASSSGPWDAFVEYDFSSDKPFPSLTDVDVIIHCAAKVHDLVSVSPSLDEYRAVNVNGTQRLLDSVKLHAVKSLVFLSSCSVYGVESITPLHESSPPSPTTPYGQSKLEAERLVATAGLPHFAILRPALIYGPNAKGNLEKMLTAIERGRFPPVPETHNRRSMVCLHDVVSAAVTVATHPAARGQTYVLEDGQHYSTRRLYEQMALALGKKPSSFVPPLCVFKALGLFGDLFGKIRGRRFFFDSDAVAKLFSSNVFDGSKITRDLDFSYEWTLEKALPDIVATRIPLS